MFSLGDNLLYLMGASLSGLVLGPVVLMLFSSHVVDDDYHENSSYCDRLGQLAAFHP